MMLGLTTVRGVSGSSCMMTFQHLTRKNVCPSHIRQDGTTGSDSIYGVAIGIDGSIFLAGETLGDWNVANQGLTDFTVVKLDADGNEIWIWQVRWKTCLYADRITPFLVNSDWVRVTHHLFDEDTANEVVKYLDTMKQTCTAYIAEYCAR